jgi:hypothetical protein
MYAYGRRPGLSKSRYPTRPAWPHGDQRFAPRRDSQTPARITFDGAMESVACLIRDMSTTGARLQLIEGADNPFLSKWANIDRIWLMVRSYRVMYDCKIVRRGESDLGVKFVSAPKAISRTPR